MIARIDGRLYVDTSAIGRLLLDEPDAPDIAATLTRYELWASELLAVEFRRLAARESLAKQAELLLTDINLVELKPGTLKRASTIPPTLVRTLDAIHLDTAVELRDQGTIDAVLTFDKQLEEGCTPNRRGLDRRRFQARGRLAGARSVRLRAGRA